MTTNRIDPTPVRMSTNLSIDRQTPKSDFGDRVNAGLQNAGNAVSSGLGVVAPMLPGGPILSAAVSSVGTMANGSSAGQSVSGQYGSMASGVTGLGAGGSLSTTIGGTGLPGAGGSAGGGIDVGGGVSASGAGGGASASMPISATDPGAGASFSIQDMAAQQGRLLNVQIAMQNENQVWSTVSNVLKVRHDTVKNTIQNVH